MAIVSNTFLTYSAIGNREDLADVIYMISPTETPFQSAIAKTKASATLHEWQTDALDTAAANAVVEGDDTSFGAVTATSRLTNRCQISRKAVIVSGTQDVVDKAGRAREMTYQLMKRSKELRRDVEFVLTNNQTPRFTGGSTTARQLRPLPGWYTTNVQAGTSGANGNSTAARTDGTTRSLTETMLKTAIQNAWEAGGEPDMVMVSPSRKTEISNFTGNANRQIDAKGKKLVAAIDVYESDFGALKVVPNRFQRTRDVHVLDTQYWALATLRPMKTEDLAKTGDAEKAHLITEYTLAARQQASSALITDIA